MADSNVQMGTAESAHRDADEGVDGLVGGVHGPCAHAGGCADDTVGAPHLDRGCGHAQAAAHHLPVHPGAC